ncbi:MAG: nucleotidyl transferase AbiEii/AbiGii toxin family protein [Dehalococcoidales bacterium]|nr:nucleotidyl transferase AbiEii/AbiGii toxin family protein [Dehalococcoidales bacterium]
MRTSMTVSDTSRPLRPLRLRIAEAARVAHKPQYVLEKDYALSYLLAGIASVPSLAESLVFKGGTCLRKAYFPGYRFSEDLDFTSRKPWAGDDLLRVLGSATEQMKMWLLAFGPFGVTVAEDHQREPHPRGQCMFSVRVQFPWMRSPDCTLKVEVSAQEPILAGWVERRLLHEFEGESLDITMSVYSLEEIVAEKLRAFLQSRQHLRDRGWLRNRPRDLYDLCYLRRQSDLPIDWRSVGRILPGKAQACGVTYAGQQDFLDEQVLAGIKRDWQAQLSNFVADPPSFEDCIVGLKAILQEVFIFQQ